MTETLHRPTVVIRERHAMAADAFLAAALIFLVAIGVQALLAYVLAGGDLESWTPPVWLEAVGALGMPLALVGGPLLTWRLYGRDTRWRDLGAGAVGVLVGSAAFSMAFMLLFVVLRFIPTPWGNEDAPWDLVIVASVAAIAFLAKPVIAAARDLAGPREHPRRHGLRLGILAVALAGIVVSVLIGGETAELGMFLALPAAPAAMAVVAMDWWREQRHER